MYAIKWLGVMPRSLAARSIHSHASAVNVTGSVRSDMRFNYHEAADSAMKITRLKGARASGESHGSATLPARPIAVLAALALTACADRPGGQIVLPSPPVKQTYHCPKPSTLPESPKLSDVLSAGLQTMQSLEECSAAQETWQKWWADQSQNARR